MHCPHFTYPAATHSRARGSDNTLNASTSKRSLEGLKVPKLILHILASSGRLI